jgi:hypothetical protein
MPLTYTGINFTLNSDNLGCLDSLSMANVASIGAGVANTTVQTAKIVPYNFKIRLVAVSCTAIDAVAGGDSFNLVVGGAIGATSQSYTQGNTAANDNSGPAGISYGYPTNVAVAGNCVFANDVPFNSANTIALNPVSSFQTTSNQGAVTTWLPSANLIGQSLPNTGWNSLATGTGGQGLFVPTNWDAVYPAYTPLSLRVTTVASTGSISNLQVELAIVAVRKRVQPVPGAPYILPATDY